jgi:glycine C-acetyltransferase
VASGAAHFRLQAMANHRDDDVDTAIDILDNFIREVGVSRW